MKKYALFLALPVLLAVLFGYGPALAAQGGFAGTPAASVGGFSGPGLTPVTVEQARTLSDDSYVVVRGNIVRHLGKDKYMFQDATASIEVEIDHDKWQGQTVTPQDTVELHGEIDRDFNLVEIDVERISIVK
jgi:uncharacterized protein (TIGR00156 family)